MSGKHHVAATIAYALPAGVLMAVVFASGCSRQPKVAADVIARVAAVDVVYIDFEGYLRRAGGDTGMGSPALSRIFDQFLEERLLQAMAQERGLLTRPQDGRTALEALLARLADEPISVQEVEAFYRQRPEEFRRPEEVHLRQILVGTRGEADQALTALEGGESMESVAARMAPSPEAGVGVLDQGRLAREDLPEAFGEVIFALQPGQVSEVVSADYGFHIFQVLARYPAEVMPLAVVEPEIRSRLRAQQLDRQVESLIAEARGRYNVEVYHANFPFDYQGDYAKPNP